MNHHMMMEPSYVNSKLAFIFLNYCMYINNLCVPYHISMKFEYVYHIILAIRVCVLLNYIYLTNNLFEKNILACYISLHSLCTLASKGNFFFLFSYLNLQIFKIWILTYKNSNIQQILSSLKYILIIFMSQINHHLLFLCIHNYQSHIKFSTYPNLWEGKN